MPQMKISEAMLYIVQQAGGEMKAIQWSLWERELHKTGYLVSEWKEGPDGKVTPYVRLTDKAKELLERKGLAAGENHQG